MFQGRAVWIQWKKMSKWLSYRSVNKRFIEVLHVRGFLLETGPDGLR